MGTPGLSTGPALLCTATPGTVPVTQVSERDPTRYVLGNAVLLSCSEWGKALPLASILATCTCFLDFWGHLLIPTSQIPSGRFYSSVSKAAYDSDNIAQWCGSEQSHRDTGPGLRDFCGCNWTHESILKPPSLILVLPLYFLGATWGWSLTQDNSNFTWCWGGVESNTPQGGEFIPIHAQLFGFWLSCSGWTCPLNRSVPTCCLLELMPPENYWFLVLNMVLRMRFTSAAVCFEASMPSVANGKF